MTTTLHWVELITKQDNCQKMQPCMQMMRILLLHQIAVFRLNCFFFVESLGKTLCKLLVPWSLHDSFIENEICKRKFTHLWFEFFIIIFIFYLFLSFLLFFSFFFLFDLIRLVSNNLKSDRFKFQLTQSKIIFSAKNAQKWEQTEKFLIIWKMKQTKMIAILRIQLIKQRK